MHNVERILELLLSNGIPVKEIAGEDPTTLNITYRDNATDTHREQAAFLLSIFDWSEEANTVWLDNQLRLSAKQDIFANDPRMIAIRNAMYLQYQLMSKILNKQNEIIEATGIAVEPLPPMPEWDVAVQMVQAQIQYFGI